MEPLVGRENSSTLGHQVVLHVSLVSQARGSGKPVTVTPKKRI